MRSFLEKTVEHLYKKYGDGISELCIVLPNRRAGLFMKTHMARDLDRTFWAPEIFATEDLVALLSELQSADPTTLLFELYEVVKEKNPNNTETFDEFSKWGQILLSDFNEIDRYLVDAKQLFGNLKSIKELDTWSLNADEPLTDFQKQYLDFWHLLGTYYASFTERILSQKQAYQGLAYRVVAEHAVELVRKHPWKKIIFAGFNALNLAEEIIIEKLLDAGMAEMIWDVDSYYVNDKNQEAGRFYRKYDQSGKFRKIKENHIVFEETLLSEGKKNITVIGAAKNVAQAKVAGSLVAELEKKNKALGTTALVLADENLLFPILHSLPAGLQDINVTMGYPLKSTPMAGFFDLLFGLHENGRKLAAGRANYRYYHTDLIRLLNHPYTGLALASADEGLNVKPVLEKLKARNVVFASYTMLEKIFNEEHPAEFKILSPLLKHWVAPQDAVPCVEYLIETVKDGIIARQDVTEENKSSLELEYLFAFTKIFKRLQVLMKDYPSSVGDIKTMRGLLNQVVRSTTLPFYGEPLMGLQVMGMLETRTLDFENVILISCNEDILPSGKSVNSFVPFELKRHFGLPTYSDKDSIFAYHFYRLLQRAENIYLLYNTENDAFGSGEKSRFLTQLQYELPKVNPNVTFREQLVNIPAHPDTGTNVIVVEKDEHIMEKLRAKAEYGFSPSLLNRYRNCSLEFYFHGIAGLKEADEVEESIGADVLGNAIHLVLERLYQPFVGKKISAEDVKQMKSKVEEYLTTAFAEEYKSTELGFGKNLLTVRVALKFIHNFLDAEIKMLGALEKKGEPLIIRSLEQELETELMIGNEKMKVKGKADRIDSIGKTVRIVDYKTGLAGDHQLKLAEMDLLSSETDLGKSFQLLMYAYMFQKMNPAIKENIVSGIITFRELSAGLKTVAVDGKEFLDESMLKDFEIQLQQVLHAIFDRKEPFKQTEDLNGCIYCSFRGICNR